MALSKEEKAQLQALMEKDKAPDEPEDYDIHIQDEKGRTIVLPYSKAKKLLQKWGFELEDVAPAPDGEPGEESDEETDEEESDEEPKPHGKGYWKK